MMKIINAILMFAVFSIMACGQNKNDKSNSKTTTNISKTETKMDTSKLTNPIVKSAINALQETNKNAWYSHFTDDAIFTDDGNKMDFRAFFDNAFNHKEKFLTFDKIENEGKNITGDFFAGQ